MGKVKVSQLFKVIICAVTLYTLGFDKIITLPGSSFVYEILIAAIGVLLALYVKNKTRSNMNLRMQCKALSNYLMIYLVIILIEMIFRKPVPQKYEAIVHAVGFALLIGFMLLITAKDIWTLIAG